MAWLRQLSLRAADVSDSSGKRLKEIEHLEANILFPPANLFGTTFGGGVGFGTVFEVTPTGVEKVLYSFTGGADGKGPHAALVLDTLGNLYGTTITGGAYDYGTVFEITATGTEKVLYSFTGGADGALPDAALVMDGNGSLYGTTFGGGASGFGYSGFGTVFELVP